jgi:enoyl-CoA hydratase
MEASEPLVLRRRDGFVETLTLNRPEVRNALNPPLIAAMAAALREVEHDDGVRAVVLTGRGDRAFCAGMDLRAFSEGGGAMAAGGGDALDDLMFVNRGEYPKPIVAAVNGAAVAGGFELVLGCDLVVAAEHAIFGLSEVKRGLFPGGGGTVLSTRVPLALALEIGLTGDAIDANRAAAIGLVNRVVPAGREVDEAVALAGRIAENAPLAVRTTKRLLRDAVARGTQHGWPTRELIDEVFHSDDALEGARAFVERRAPTWIGH